MTERLLNETFRAHQPIIGRWARLNSDNFADVYRFVLATIQQPLSTTPEIVESFKTEGRGSKWAFGAKREALDYIEDHSGLIYDNAMWIWERGGDRALLSYLALLPGLGLVKAGFLAQLAFGQVGCLDRHNVARFGLGRRVLRGDRFKNAKTTAKRQEIITEYMELCEKCGGCALLWAEWCEYVAERDPSFDSAADVSRMHLTALGLTEEAFDVAA